MAISFAFQIHPDLQYKSCQPVGLTYKQFIHGRILSLSRLE